MYLPSLQKNIQELDRQISLLESECECMETDKREIIHSNKTNSKTTVKELPNTPFVTGPSVSSSTYLTRMRIFSPVLPKMYSSSCRHPKAMSDEFSTVGHARQSSYSHNNHLITFDNSKPVERKIKTANVLGETQTDFLHVEKGRVDEGKPKVTITEPRKRSMSLIKEVSESSDENVAIGLTRNRKKSLQEPPKGQTRSELPNEKYSKNKKQERKQPKNSRTETLVSLNFLEQKFSSDEENYTGKSYGEGESKSLNAKWSSENEISGTPRRKNLINRRPRSARTQKNKASEIPLDLNITKTLQEKEIQCTLEKERENTDFLFNLNHAIKELIQLIGKLKTKSSREKSNEVLNDMQNTLSKISKIKSMNTIFNSLNMLGTLNGAHLKLPEDEENILVLRKTLLGIKKFCKELTEEKSILTDELAVKSHALENFKSKEKEYLSLISSLKFNLEKMKEEAEEGACARRDLKFLKIKLQEETKVIEALKKSHEKMQELVENYVLENDKLRTQLKIIKLESQKFNVLLAGKEMEINKYKKEIESFQRQITEQLSLLRSKATENEIGCALETISNQTNFLQTEAESNPSEAIFEKDFNEDSALVTTETTSECFSVRIRQVTQNNQFSPPLDLPDTEFKNIQGTEFENENKMQKTKRSADVSDSTTCKSNDFEPESNSERHLGLQKVLSSSKNLRSSIDELLEDFKRENSDNQWSNLPNSCNTSSQTTLLTITSDDAP